MGGKDILEIIKVLIIVFTGVLLEFDFTIVIAASFANVLVDLRRSWNLTVLDQITSLVGCVLLNDIGLFVLELSQR